MLVLSRSEVKSLLDLDALVEAVAAAMAEYSAGRVSMPTRVAAHFAERRAFLAAMPAFRPSARALTTKLVSLFPQNQDRPTHEALICCFDPDNGSPLAQMDGTYVTSARTAAGSVLASRLLARDDARTVSIIGTGVQARAHARAFSRRPGKQVILIAGRDQQKVAALVSELRADGLQLEAAASIQAAVHAADIVCTTTHADQPVLRRDWLRPGTHLNCVGYNSSGQGQVDAATVRDAVVVVESREAALAPPPAGAVELRRAIESGVIGAGHVRAEIGELVTGALCVRHERADLAALARRSSQGIAGPSEPGSIIVLDVMNETTRLPGPTAEITYVEPDFTVHQAAAAAAGRPDHGLSAGENPGARWLPVLLSRRCSRVHNV
jgi:alanine dehydrogenase